MNDVTKEEVNSVIEGNACSCSVCGSYTVIQILTSQYVSNAGAPNEACKLSKPFFPTYRQATCNREEKHPFGEGGGETRALTRPIRREDNIKIVLEEIGCDYVD
jgi:hypothetical protein